MPSLSFQMIGRVSDFRNPITPTASRNIFKSGLAEVGYIAIVPFAFVEAAISQVVKAMARCLPIKAASYQHVSDWARSSTNAYYWSVYCVVSNLFLKNIIPKDVGLTANSGRTSTVHNGNTSNIKLGPVVVEVDVSELLKKFELADNSKRYSPCFEKMYQAIPAPTDVELAQIGDDLFNLFPANHHKAVKIRREIKDIASKECRSAWENRYLAMLIAVKKALTLRNDPSDLEVFRETLVYMHDNCNNRKSTDLENFFISYVAPHLSADYIESLKPEERITYDLTQYRMSLRDEIISFVCKEDSHNAASHNYFRRTLNPIFMLPPSPLSDLDLDYESYAKKAYQAAITSNFSSHYNSPNTIYKVFLGLLYPETGDMSKFKPELFLKWLEANGKKNADSFVDDDLKKYKPAIVIEYLVELSFLKPKAAV